MDGQNAKRAASWLAYHRGVVPHTASDRPIAGSAPRTIEAGVAERYTAKGDDRAHASVPTMTLPLSARPLAVDPGDKAPPAGVTLPSMASLPSVDPGQPGWDKPKLRGGAG